MSPWGLATTNSYRLERRATKVPDEDEETSNLQHFMPPPDNGSEQTATIESSKPIDRWLALVGLAAGVVLFLLPKTRVIVIVGCFAIFALLAYPVWNFWWIERKLRRQLVAIILLAAFAALIGYAAWSLPEGVPANSKAMPSQVGSSSSTPLSTRVVPTPAYYSTPLSLNELFDTDFPYLNANHGLLLESVPKGHELMLRLRIIFDTDERTKFVAAYIPFDPDSRFAYAACFALASELPATVNAITLQSTSSISRPDETSPTFLKELSFSGRIYIYYENDFSVDELATLNQEYRRLGLASEFRGVGYLKQHENEKRLVVAPWHEGTITLPAKNVLVDQERLELIIKNPKLPPPQDVYVRVPPESH
jgi:hypothetical protein